MKELSEDDRIPFLNDDERETEGISRQHAKIGSKTWPFWFPLTLAIILLSNIVTVYTSRQYWNRSLDKTCAIHTSQYKTSVFDDVEIRYNTVLFNGSLTKASIYRQPPSPDVDAAWEDLGIEYKPIIVPPQQIEAAGIPADRFRVSERYGGPGYPAIMEGLHQLHCLNFIRQGLYFNVDYYRTLRKGSWLNSDDMVQLHLGHCLDILRQRLMCTADTGLHPFLWAGSPPHIFPDFNRQYKCRNFDEIREYAKMHQATYDELDVFPQEGELVLDAIP